MLADFTANFLPMLRAEAEARMIDTVRITRPQRPTTGTGGSVEKSAPEVYGPNTSPHRGKALWKAPATFAQSAEVGTATPVLTPGSVHIPVATSATGYTPMPGDVIELLASPTDPASVGRKVTVESRFGGTNLTQYQIPIKGA